MALIQKDTLKTFKLAKQAERDDLIRADRVAIAKERAAAWARKRTLEDLAQALLTAEQAEARSASTAEKCRGVSNA